MKILSVVGARPQFIKAALVCRGLRDAGFQEILVHTGQHYDLNMSDVFFDDLNIPSPNYHLGIGSGSHGKQTGRMLSEIEELIYGEDPDLVLVYGDTNSTLAGALAASKLNVPIAHVEAGLRSYNRNMPEEINRVLTDHVSSVLFCPTGVAVENLRKEGFECIANEGALIGRECDVPGAGPLRAGRDSGKPVVVNVGDVMYDVASRIRDQVDVAAVLEGYNVESKKYVLVTIHRAENTDDPLNLKTLWECLLTMVDMGTTIIFPLHPRTRKAFNDIGITPDLRGDTGGRLMVVDPVSYRDMIALESNASSIVTDSGGVQKEGYFFRVPCIIPRSETEWVELVDAGWNVVTGIDKDRITQAVASLPDAVSRNEWRQFYGDGHAVDRIVNVLKILG